MQNAAKREQKPVMLYQHGLMDSSAGAVCNGKDSFVYKYADAGYDVWMNNSRGNKFSRHHKYLCPDTHKKFWDYSFQEMADYDLPAVFDYIFKETGCSSLTYIGHSQGTMQMLSALSTNPEYWRPKINVAILLAPVHTMHRCNAKEPHKIKDNPNFAKAL